MGIRKRSDGDKKYGKEMKWKKMEGKRMEDPGRPREGWKRGLCDRKSREQRFTASAVGRSWGHGLLLSL